MVGAQDDWRDVSQMWGWGVSWFFVDDGFYDHPKLAVLSPAERWPAIGLWTSAGAWSRKKLTGGVIPYHQVDSLGCTHEIAASLVKCELWSRTETGYEFHDWKDWQETPEEVQRKRVESKKRSKAWRDKRAKSGKKTSQRTNGVRTAYERESNAPRTLRVPGEGEGDGSYKHEEREELAADNDTARADAALVRLRAVAG